MHWAGCCPRFMEHEFKAVDVLRRDGRRQRAGLADLARRRRALLRPGRGEDRLHRHERDPAAAGQQQLQGVRERRPAVGYKRFHTGRYASAPVAHDGRPATNQDGFNFQGVKDASKWSTLTVELPRAAATGKLDLRAEAHVTRIEHDDQGLVTGVTYVDGDGLEHFQRARLVAVAGNSIETARLLLYSESSQFPDGLANSSGQVGRNYMRHLTASVYAIFDQPVRFYRGETMAGHIEDNAPNDPGRGFVGGYYMQLLALGVPFMAAFMDPGGWGRDFTSALERYENMAGMWLVGEDMPQETNRVTLNRDVLDQYGRPVPDVHFDDHPNDLAMREHAWAAGRGAVRRGRRGPDDPHPALPGDAQPRHGADERAARGRRRQRVRPGARRPEPVRLRRQPVHDRARPRTRR